MVGDIPKPSTLHISASAQQQMQTSLLPNLEVFGSKFNNANPSCPPAVSIRHITKVRVIFMVIHRWLHLHRNICIINCLHYNDKDSCLWLHFSLRPREWVISPVPDPMLPCLHFNRFGAATMAVPKGIPDNLIKALGQWTSEAYQGYFCLLREQLPSVTTMLAQSVKGQQSLPVEYRVGCATVQVVRQCV